MDDQTATARTLLFTPADRPDRFARAQDSGADLSVLDLEDAVPPDRKRRALENAVAWLADHDGAVRVNDADSTWSANEMAALRDVDCTIVLPKATARTLRLLHAALAAGTGRHAVVALVETAEGVIGADRIAQLAFVARLALGTFDLAAEIGVDPALSPMTDRARERLSFAAAAAGLPGPIDGVTASVSDTSALTTDVRHAIAFGFTGKLCIHPSQVAPVHAAFAPTSDEIDWARGVLRAARATSGQAAVFVHDGRMVDRPVLVRAERIISLAGEHHP